MYSLYPTQAQDTSWYGPLTQEATAMWREQAIQTYTSTRTLRTVTLQAELARRIKELAGYYPAPKMVYADADTQFATYFMDGTLFRLERENLTIVRSCAYCGTGQFSSPTINDIADLGYALAVWQPLHDDCWPEDLADWL